MADENKKKRPLGRHRKRSGRRASTALFVMLEPKQKARYERLARGMNMTLRELVVAAIEQISATYHAPAKQPMLPVPSSTLEEPSNFESPRAEIDVPWMMRAVTGLLSRFGALEECSRSQATQIEELQTQAAVHWGSDWRTPVSWPETPRR